MSAALRSCASRYLNSAINASSSSDDAIAITNCGGRLGACRIAGAAAARDVGAVLAPTVLRGTAKPVGAIDGGRRRPPVAGGFVLAIR